MQPTRQKIIKEDQYSITTGYRNDNNDFIWHSFDGEPAIIYHSGIKEWYDDGEQYWFIENHRFHSLDEVRKKYKDKIFKTTNHIHRELIDNNIDFIYLNWYSYLIFDDTDRNEVILKYG